MTDLKRFCTFVCLPYRVAESVGRSLCSHKRCITRVTSCSNAVDAPWLITRAPNAGWSLLQPLELPPRCTRPRPTATPAPTSTRRRMRGSSVPDQMERLVIHPQHVGERGVLAAAESEGPEKARKLQEKRGGDQAMVGFTPSSDLALGKSFFARGLRSHE